MATTITAADVKAGFTTTLADAEIDMLISVVSEADACLDANNVASDRQKALKLYAVRHLLALQENDGRGKATSEQASNGAGRSFSTWQGKDLASTRYGAMVKQLDTFGCIRSVLEPGTNISIRSVGRRACVP
jgi:hypothetical protein